MLAKQNCIGEWKRCQEHNVDTNSMVLLWIYRKTVGENWKSFVRNKRRQKNRMQISNKVLCGWFVEKEKDLGNLIRGQ